MRYIGIGKPVKIDEHGMAIDIDNNESIGYAITDIDESGYINVILNSSPPSVVKIKYKYNNKISRSREEIIKVRLNAVFG